MEQPPAIAAERAKPSGSDGDAAAGEDRFSSLPDDILVLILLCLGAAAAAGRTSVLSRRWRRVWALLPELRFPAAPPPHVIASALAAHGAALRYLLVEVEGAAPESVAAWLPIAARRLSGSLVFRNRVNDGGAVVAAKGAAFELPCFERAASVSLDLGFLAIAVPPAGVFAGLTELTLKRVRFRGRCKLGDAISSPRCPCLQKLSICRAHGLHNVVIHSESLLKVELYALELQQLTVVAPELQQLQLSSCFTETRPAANISTPQLVFLLWRDLYDPSSVQLGNLGHLKWLTTNSFRVYGQQDSVMNGSFLRLLEWFPVIDNLHIQFDYPYYIGNLPFLIESLTTLPQIKILTLSLHNKGHNFGASLFHVLSLCTGLGVLSLVLHTHGDVEVQFTCPSGCACNQTTNWKTKLILENLQEVMLIDMKGSDRELAVLQRLLSWAVNLKKLRVFYRLVTLSKAKEVHEKLLSLDMPKTLVTLAEFPCNV